MNLNKGGVTLSRLVADGINNMSDNLQTVVRPPASRFHPPHLQRRIVEMAHLLPVLDGIQATCVNLWGRLRIFQDGGEDIMISGETDAGNRPVADHGVS